MSIAHKILGNTFAQIAGKIITAFIALLTVNILSDYFSASELGDYGTVYSYLALFGAVADMGIYTLVLRDMSKKESNPSELYGLGTTLRIIITFIAMVLAIGIAFLIPQYANTDIPTGVIIVAVGTFFILMSGTVSVVLQYALKMKYYQYSMIIGKICIFLGIISITKYFYPIVDGEHTGGIIPFYWILTLGTFGAFIIMVLTFWFSQKQLPLKLYFEGEKLKKLFHQALPFGLSMILTTFYFQMGMLFLGWMLPRSTDGICASEFCGDIESGKYIIALRMMEVLLYFPVFFMTSLLPTMTKSIEEKSANKSKIFSYGLLFLFALGLPFAVGGFFLSTPMASILGNEKLLTVGNIFGSDTAFSLLSIALFFAFCNYFFSYALIALNQQKQVLKINILIVCIGIACNLILIPRLGLLGAGITTILCETLLFGLMFLSLQKNSPFRLPFAQLFKIILATGLMGIFLYMSVDVLFLHYGKYIAFVLCSLVSAILFFGTLWGTQFLTDEMKAVIKR